MDIGYPNLFMKKNFKDAEHLYTKIWRRGYYDKPPNGENLDDLYNRVRDFYNSTVNSFIEQGNTVLISAHGNSLRALFPISGGSQKNAYISF